MQQKATGRVLGWKLARRVAASALYEELNDLERAECDELVARCPASQKADERVPDQVTCRLAFCLYKDDCERMSYCQAAILQTSKYRRLLADDVLPTLKRLLETTGTHHDDLGLMQEIRALYARVNRTV